MTAGETVAINPGGPGRTLVIDVMGYAGGFGGFGVNGTIWLLGCVALLVGVVLLVAWAVSRLGLANGDERAGRTDALEVLRLRFAEGEINADEFHKAAGVLKADR